MDTTRSAVGPDPLPGLWVADLRSYAFGIRTAMGSTPMRYVVARRFDGQPARAAVTVLFVIEPAVLLGTYVRIDEDVAVGTCAVHTYLPTMAKPLVVAGELVFDCLPLTDVGYLDLMAWLPPLLRAEDASDRGGPESSAPVDRTFRFDPEFGPSLWLHETLAAGPAVVVRRSFRRNGAEIRRWEVTEHGERGCEGLPRQIRVSRPLTGHQTDFTRSTAPTAVPPDLFDSDPYVLWKSLTAVLGEEGAGAPHPPA
jgi:hypothetical protein